MDSDDIFMAVTCAMIAVLLMAAWGLSVYRCGARWDRSGMASEFRVFAGCLVKTDHGWVPEDRFREIQP